MKAVVLDIDGVLTDGMITFDANGNEYRSINLSELDALSLIKDMGWIIAAVTPEDGPMMQQFMKRAEWDGFITGCDDIVDGIMQFEENFSLKAAEIIYVGEGKCDIEAVKYAGCGICPANAINEVKEVSDFVLDGYGGKDCIKALLKFLKDNPM